uniref:SGTA homodimerisation domain-containing protein n=1 Tax=Ditylenchus dipsaci TaxID=166011 RepID=A0A915DM45_9BILA
MLFSVYAMASVAAKMEISNGEKNLVVSFIQFMREKVSQSASEEQVSGIELAINALEHAFGIIDVDYAFQASKPLLNVFLEAENGSEMGEYKVPTAGDLLAANNLKEEGNELVKSNKLDEAISKYGEAIKLVRDPVFFCNRAAVYCRLEQFDLAIQDCRTAIALNPKYAKAYARLGLVFSSIPNGFAQSVEAYQQALELDPDNDGYKKNLEVVKEKLQESQSVAANQGNTQSAGFASFLNNPAMIRMTTQIFSDPSIMSEVMGNFTAGNDAPGGLDGLLRAGQQMAERMGELHPEMIEQLRGALGGLGAQVAGAAASQTDGQQEERHDNEGPNESADKK